MTVDLNSLANWLTYGVDTVALESTGVYLIPVYEVLEQRGLPEDPAEPVLGFCLQRSVHPTGGVRPAQPDAGGCRRGLQQRQRGEQRAATAPLAHAPGVTECFVRG
jgi:hypothetical protein